MSEQTPPRPRPIVLAPDVPADRGTGSQALGVAVLALSGVYTAGAVVGEVFFGLGALAYAEGRDPSTPVALAAGVLGVGTVVLLLPLWVVTSLWLGAERRRQGTPPPFRHGTAATFASWVVPFVNLVWPLRVVTEVHDRATSPYRFPLGTWWALWVLSLLVGQVSSRISLAQGYGDGAAAVLVFSAAYVVLLLAAAVCWFGVVRRIVWPAVRPGTR